MIALVLCTAIPALSSGPAYAQSTVTVTLTQSNTEDQDIPDRDNTNTPLGLLETSLDFEADTPNRFIHAVSVVVNISHTFREDLQILLITPSTKTVTLRSREGGGANFVSEELSYTSENTFSLAGLIGDSVVGRWTLRIEDHAPQDVGTLHGVHLTFEVGSRETIPFPGLFSGFTGMVEEARGRNNAIEATPMTTGTARISCAATFTTQSGVTGTYGRFTIDADGTWTYTLDNENPATEALWPGRGSTNPTATEIFPITASCTYSDGNTISGTDNVVITVRGGNDDPQFENIRPEEQVSGTTRDFQVAFSDQDISAGDELELLGMVSISDRGVTSISSTPMRVDAAANPTVWTFPYTAPTVTTNSEVTMIFPQAADVEGATSRSGVSRQITILPPLAFATGIEDQVYVGGLLIPDLVLPEADGGVGDKIYTLTRPGGARLPDWLNFNPETRTISGTAPDLAQDAETYTYTVRDSDTPPNTDQLTFDITVVADTAPSFGDASIADQEYILGLTENLELELPAAAGGNGALAYTLTPTLPAGLTFDANADPPTLGGTPLTAQAATAYTYTASDADANTEFSDVATLTFTIAVAADTAPSFGDESIADQDYITGTEIEVMLPAAAGGNGALAYTLTPTLPAGLMFDPNADPPTISGTPMAVHDAIYTYTASDADANTEFSDVATLTFTIAVAADTAPRFDVTEPLSFVFGRGVQINRVLSPVSGGNGELEYRVSPSLPLGLELLTDDNDLPHLSGRPSTVQDVTEYELVVSDSDANTRPDDSNTLRFTITVVEEPPSAPTFADDPMTFYIFTFGRSTEQTLTGVTGGNGELIYNVSPSLPTGLELHVDDEGMPSLRGRALAVQGVTDYELAVSDSDEDESAGDSATLMFTIAVTTARVTVSFDEPAVSVTGGTTRMVTVSATGDVESLGANLLAIGLEAAAGIEAMPSVVRLSAGTSSAAVTLSVAGGSAAGSVSLSQQDLLEHIEVTPGTPLSVTVLPRTVALSVLGASASLILGERRRLVVTTDPALQGNETAEISVVSSASSVLEVIGASVVVLNQSAPTGAVTLRVPENLELPQSVTLTVSVEDDSNVEVAPSLKEVMIELVDALRFKIRAFLEGAVQ